MTRRLPVFLVLAVLGPLMGCANKSSPTEPNSPSTTEVFYTAIGASDATGYGGSIPCLPYTPCEGGTGYVPVIVRQLEGAGNKVTLMNLGIPGAVVSPEVQALGNLLGRGIYANFLYNEAPFVPRNTTVVTVFAGGNDANTIGAALEAGMATPDANTWVQTETQAFGRDLRTLVATVKDRAAQVRIVFLNLPNLAGLPYASGYTLEQKRWLQLIAVGFSAQINSLVAQGAIVVDMMCDSRFYQSSYYSSDGFHPNDSGYAAMAQLAASAVATGSSSAPKASCVQMVLY